MGGWVEGRVVCWEGGVRREWVFGRVWVDEVGMG